MTISEVSTSLYNLSVGGYFNGEKFSKARLESHIRGLFRDGVSLKLKNRIVMEIDLPDGRWLFTINKYADRADGFDYTIPDTREQEQRLWNELVS